MGFTVQASFLLSDSLTGGLPVTGKTNSTDYTHIYLCEDGTNGSDIKNSATIAEDGAGNYHITTTTAGTPVREVKLIVIPVTATVVATPSMVGAMDLAHLSATPIQVALANVSHGGAASTLELATVTANIAKETGGNLAALKSGLILASGIVGATVTANSFYTNLTAPFVGCFADNSVVFTSGACAGTSVMITSNNVTNGTLTIFGGMPGYPTVMPVPGDTFVIVPFIVDNNYIYRIANGVDGTGKAILAGTQSAYAPAKASDILATPGTPLFNGTDGSMKLGSSTSTALLAIGGAVLTDATKKLFSGADGSMKLGVSTATALAAMKTALTLPTGIKYGVALPNFSFVMFKKGTNTPQAGLTPTVTIKKDAGAFAAPSTPTVTEIANGWYSVSLAIADMTAAKIAFRATDASNTADDTDLILITNA